MTRREWPFSKSWAIWAFWAVCCSTVPAQSPAPVAPPPPSIGSRAGGLPPTPLGTARPDTVAVAGRNLGQQPPPPAPPDVHFRRGVPLQTPGEAARQLTLTQLEQSALANNPAVSQARAKWLAAKGRCVQAGLYPNPTVGYLGVEMGIDDRSGQQGGYVSQQIVTAGKLRWSRAEAAQQMREAEFALGAAQLRVLTDVRIRFHAALIAEQGTVLTAELVRLAEETVRATEGLLKAEEVSRIELLQAELEAESARLMLTEAQRRAEAECRVLAGLVGRPAISANDLVGDFEHLPEPLDWQQALGQILGESPELAAAEAAVERARCTLVLARRQAFPDVEVELDVQHDNSSSDDFASVILSVPLPLFNRNQGNIAAAQAELTAAQQQAQRTRLDLQTRLAEAYYRYQSARTQAERYRNVILPRTDELYHLSSQAYAQGEIGYLALLTAGRSLVQAHMDYLSVLSAAHAERARIEGLLLEGSLSADL